MCGKCYPITDGFYVPHRIPKGSESPKWRILAQVSEAVYILCSTLDTHVRYAPLYIHKFRLIAPRRLLDAQRFQQQYHSYGELLTVQDRLRWCRHHMGLMQKEVADRIGIRRGHYTDLETGAVDYYPKEVVDKLAALFGIPVTDLLDDFSRFLYYGQGKAIREHRERLGLQKKPYARLLHLEPNRLRAWESEKKQISKASWEKYFKGVIVV